MKHYTIIWDFDGTILPTDPYDSEQSLLRHLLKNADGNISSLKRIVAKIAILADRKEWIGQAFKRYYVWVLKGTPAAALDRVSHRLAAKISPSDRKALRSLHEMGHRLLLISCGTLDLSERILRHAGLVDIFDSIYGNRFQWHRDRIVGMDLQLLGPNDKLNAVVRAGIAAETAIAVGDGYTDLPLLDWVDIPILLDRSGLKQKKLRHKKYRFVSSIPEVVEMIKKETGY